MNSFDRLVSSRRTWIDETLRPWCATASRRELLQAEQEWIDIAGRAAPEVTLWTWVWDRFPVLVGENLKGVDETREVVVVLRDGRSIQGYPDGRQSERGQLCLVSLSSSGAMEQFGPWSIDEIQSVALASST